MEGWPGKSHTLDPRPSSAPPRPKRTPHLAAAVLVVYLVAFAHSLHMYFVTIHSIMVVYVLVDGREHARAHNRPRIAVERGNSGSWYGNTRQLNLPHSQAGRRWEDPG